MKFLFSLCVLFYCFAPAQAQLLKKLKSKVQKAVDQSVAPDNGASNSSTKQKEDAASGEYSDATENNERPIFIDKGPANGKMVLKLKKDDRFWGSYVRLKGQPGKADAAASILDYLDARILAFYPLGEVSQYFIYINGKRIKNDSLTIGVRPEYIEWAINKSPYFTGTEAKVTMPAGSITTQDDVNKMTTGGNLSLADMQKMADKMKDMTPEQQAAYAQSNFKVPSAQQQQDIKKVTADSKDRTNPVVTQGTFAFENNGIKYGPFTGVGINMMVFKPMEPGTPGNKFYGLGGEPFFGKKEAGYHAVIQTSEKVTRINDYPIGGLFEPTYPTGAQILVQGKKDFNFTDGTTVPIPAKPVFMDSGVLNVLIYGTDAGHIVCIPSGMQQISDGGAKTAWIDYKTKVTYAVPIDKQHLLIATDPAKSVLYKNHTVYYPDGRKEILDNVGDAQLYNFKGKDYLLWFEVMKIDNGHEIYVCQKELN
ncbi:MAG: hypothetical protein ABI203_06635 [Mucilaginibacter sp.]